MTQMSLISFYLPHPFERSEIEQRLDVTLTRSIESNFYANIGDALVTFTQFNVFTIINASEAQILEILNALQIEDALQFKQNGFYQDYAIRIDSALSQPFKVTNDAITFQSASHISLVITAHVISQSVALEQFENRLASYHERSRELIESADTRSILKRNRLARFAKELVLMRHDMLIDLHLLDKPDILWDNPETEQFYMSLSSALELKNRYDIVVHKLESIKDDIVMVMDLVNHNHSSFLEWIIIILIGVEIIMGLMEWFQVVH